MNNYAWGSIDFQGKFAREILIAVWYFISCSGSSNSGLRRRCMADARQNLLEALMVSISSIDLMGRKRVVSFRQPMQNLGFRVQVEQQQARIFGSLKLMPVTPSSVKTSAALVSRVANIQQNGIRTEQRIVESLAIALGDPRTNQAQQRVVLHRI